MYFKLPDESDFLNELKPDEKPNFEGFDVNTTPKLGLHLDVVEQMQDLVQSIQSNDLNLIHRDLVFFKTAIIQNKDNIPEELYKFHVTETLVQLITPKFPINVMCQAFNAAIAWSAVQSSDYESFEYEDFINFLMFFVVEQCSRADTFKYGILALTLLKNIIHDGTTSKVQFVALNGFEIYALLYNEFHKVEHMKLITSIFHSILSDENVEIPLNLGHFITDMYLPTFRSDLSTLTEYDIEVIHMFCTKSIQHIAYFMKTIGPNKLFAAYCTGNLELRISILEFWAKILTCPSPKIIEDAVLVPWDLIINAVSISHENKELQMMCDILINAFNHGSASEEEIFKSNVIFELMNILSFGSLDMRKTVIETLSILVERDIGRVIRYIIENEYLDTVYDLIECQSEIVVDFSLKLLLKLLNVSFQDPKLALKTIDALSKIDFQDATNEILDDQEKDYGAMYDIFVDKAIELLENPPPPIEEDPQEIFKKYMEQLREQNSDNYDEEEQESDDSDDIAGFSIYPGKTFKEEEGWVPNPDDDDDSSWEDVE